MRNERELLKEYQKPDISTDRRDEIFEMFLDQWTPLIERMSYKGDVKNVDDNRQVSMMALHQCMLKFDCDGKNKFMTYLWHSISGSVLKEYGMFLGYNYSYHKSRGREFLSVEFQDFLGGFSVDQEQDKVDEKDYVEWLLSLDEGSEILAKHYLEGMTHRELKKTYSCPSHLILKSLENIKRKLRGAGIKKEKPVDKEIKRYQAEYYKKNKDRLKKKNKEYYAKNKDKWRKQ